MRKIVLILFVCHFTFLHAADKPVLAVAPLSNLTDEVWMDNLGNMVNDVIFLTLSLMGSYDIVRTDESSFLMNQDNLRELATEMNYDDLIFGDCNITDEGYRISLTVYDRFEDKITVSRVEEFESVMDSFEAADRLVESLIEGLSGVHVSYGSLDISLITNEPFRTRIDSVEMEAGFTGADKIVSGEHQLEFFQDRGRGETPVSLWDITVPEGERVTLYNPIPWLTAEEKSYFDTHDRAIGEAGDQKERISLTEDFFLNVLNQSDNPFFTQYRKEVRERYLVWAERYERPLSVPGIVISSHHKLGQYMRKAPYNRLSMVKTEPLSTSMASKSRVFNNLLKNEIRSNLVLPDYAEVTLDGNDRDWQNVKSILPGGKGYLFPEFIKNGGESGPGQDITEGGIATDGKNMYFLMRLDSGKLKKDRKFAIYLSARNKMNICYYSSDNSSGGYWLKGQNSAQSYPVESFARVRAGTVIEYAVPIDQILKKVKPGNSEVTLRFSVKDEISNNKIDEFVYNFFLPDLYYSLKEGMDH